MKFLLTFSRRGRIPLAGNKFSGLIPLLLLLSLSIALIRWGRPAQAQGECKVECTATAPATAQVSTSVPFASTASAAGCASSPMYEWDFGDGTQTSLQQNTTHTYAAPGTYAWKLTTSAAVASTTIDTIAGGYGEHAPARQAPFTTATAVARDPLSRGIYLLDEADNGSLIRFLNTSTTTVTIAGKTIEAGKIRRLAGDSGGAISQNDWDIPISTVAFAARGLAVNSTGNLLYFSDAANSRVWVYNVSSALQTVGTRTLAPGNVGALATTGNGDVGNLAVHPTTGEVFVVQGVTAGNRISRIDPSGTLTTVAGNGAATKINDPFPQPPVNATDLPLLTPGDILFDAVGNLYIADTGHARVVRVEAGGLAFQAYQFTFGPGGSNPFPAGLAVIGNKVYVAAGNQQTIVEVASGSIVAGNANTSCDYTSSNCGDGGNRSVAAFFMQGSTSTPPILGLESDASGLYILDQGSIRKGRVRYVNLGGAPVQLAGTTIASNNVDTIAGSGLSKPYDTGLAISATLSAPVGVAIDANGNLFIADTLASRLRFVNRGSNVVTLFAGTPAQQIVEPGAVVTINKNVGVGATDNTPANQAGFDIPQGLAVTNQGVFIADSRGGPAVDLRRTGLIRFVNTSGASVTFFPSAATPIIVPPGNVATIAGGGSSTAGTIGIGNGGFARNARFLAPSDVAVNQMSGDIYVADAGNKAVRRISGSSGVVSNLNLPIAQYTGLAFDPASRLHIANHDSGQVWRETAAGTGVFNPINTTPINNIRDVAVDAAGAVYVMTISEEIDPQQSRIVRITAAGATEPVAGTTIGYDGDGGPALAAKLSFTPDPINVATLGPPVIVPQTVNIAIGASGEIVFADTRNNRIRRIGPGTANCVKTGQITITGDNPVPALTQLTPSTAVVGAREFSLTVTGSGFVTESKLRWNGVERQTNYISSTQLTAIIPPSDLGSAGTALITVFNPPPRGGISAPLSLSIRQPNPIPALASISPLRAAIGTAFTLRVAGSGFVPGSVVQWKGSNRPTTFVGTTQLTAEIPATDLATAGQALVAVFNPEPAGGLTTAAVFTITATNPAPSLMRLIPQAVVAGGGSFPLQVYGTNFAVNSRVRVNGQDRSTTFNDDGWLTAQVTAADIASPGVANISVFTPTPGGGITAQMTLPVGVQFTSVPASSFAGTTVAIESIVAAFGVELAAAVEVATTQPLPTKLGQTTVTIRDDAGKETLAPLFFVSPTQVNYLIPAGVPTGSAIIIVKVGERIAGVGGAQITSILPGIFSANANGQGVAAAVALRMDAAGKQTFEPIAVYSPVQQMFVPVPLELGAGTDQVFLLLYGTGFRNRSGLPAVRVRIGGVDVPVLSAGPALGFSGLDQLNCGPIPRILLGRGPVEIIVTVDNRIANTVQLTIK